MAEPGETLEGTINIQPLMIAENGLSFNLSIPQEVILIMTGDVSVFVSSAGNILFNETN